MALVLSRHRTVSHDILGFLTVLVQEELVESQAAGLFADEAVHVLRAVVVHGDGVLQGFDARLQAEGDLGVAHGVPAKQMIGSACAGEWRRFFGKLGLYLCPSTVHRATAHRSGLKRASWGM